MIKTKEQKKEALQELQQNLDKNGSVYFIDYKGLPADDLFELRSKVRSDGGLLYVAKKTLVRLALKEKGVEVGDEMLDGQTALVFGFEDEVAPLKSTYEYQKEKESPKLLGGIFDGEVIDSKGVMELAQLPSRSELEAKMVGILKAPLFNLRGSLENNMKGLLVVLSSKQ